ncbi:MAG: signal peptide peptidase SppA [Candidatus Sulfobium sp.]
MKKSLFLLLVSLLVFSGCAVSLLPRTKPLEETLLEGKGKQKILLVDLDGVISFKEKAGYMGLKKRPSMVAFFRETLLKAAADRDVAGVIVRINSPGGSVAASDTIYHEIMSFREKKKVPVYAQIMGLGTSGAYYVASAADRIAASPSAITGSIGVIAMKINVEQLLSKIGVSEETYKSGPKKDFWSPFRPSTDDEKKMLQQIIDNLYDRFLDVVDKSRQKVLTGEEVRTLADGRILTADDALKAKLIDQVSYLDETIDTMKKALHVGNARVITYIRPSTFKSNIYSEYPGMPMTGPQVINLLSIDADELPFSPGVRFMYLWNP